MWTPGLDLSTTDLKREWPENITGVANNPSEHIACHLNRCEITLEGPTSFLLSLPEVNLDIQLAISCPSWSCDSHVICVDLFCTRHRVSWKPIKNITWLWNVQVQYWKVIIGKLCLSQFLVCQDMFNTMHYDKLLMCQNAQEPVLNGEPAWLQHIGMRQSQVYLPD